MKREKIRSAVLLILLSVLLYGCCSPPSSSSVGVNLVPQQRDWWCWAATTEMISDYYGHGVDQCNSANYIHGTPPNCCTEGCSGDCSCWGSGWGASINDIKNNWTHWNFSYDYSASNLSWDDLKETISTTSNCDRSPIQAVWWWAGGGGHVVTVYGYSQPEGVKMVSYRNPWPPDCEEPAGAGDSCSPTAGGESVVSTYNAFVNDGTHSWGNSFYKFRYTGP